MQNSKFRTILGLILIYLAVFLGWQWIWGILFLIWVVPDLFSGITYFMEPIEKKNNPVLYWLIILSWIWMSVYMIATPFLPQFDGQNIPTFQPTKEIGIYEDNPIEKIIKSPMTEVVDENKSITKQEKVNQGQVKNEHSVSTKDILKYKSYHQKETHYYVGISVDMNVNDPDFEKHTNDLWEYFYSNDISQVIPNIVDKRIYFIYSEQDKEGNYKATIAYRTKDIKTIYEGLEKVQISPSKYAVFEQTNSDSDKFISETWTNIYASDLNFNTGFNMEVYELDANYKVKKAEIRIAIK